MAEGETASIGMPLYDEDIDAETAAIIAELALEDLNDQAMSSKGKGRIGGPLSDAEFAFQPQTDYVKQQLALAEDEKETSRAFGKQPQISFGYDQWRDESTVCGDSDSDETMEGPNQRIALDRIASERSRGVYAPSGSNTIPLKSVRCISCDESFKPNKVLEVPCEHYYCKGCIGTLVNLLTRDESLYPLRCCQKQIPVDTVMPFLSNDLRSLFEAKHAELRVLSKDRVYCSQPTCSTFLGSSEGLTGCTGIICPRCTHSTCPRCKDAAHGEEDCAVNHSNIAVRALARAEGWQTCPGCDRLIELQVGGCYHMTCRCRAEFCYLCATPWKDCECAQWDEERLVVAAEGRVMNEVRAQAARAMQPAVFQQRVEERARGLRYIHDCVQRCWKNRWGGRRML